MRLIATIAAILAAALVAAEPASAQVRVQGYGAPKAVKVQPHLQPHLKQPRAKPPIFLIPPSAALSRALAMAPNAKPIGVRLKGNLYIIRLKQGNKVMQVRVNAATGALAP
jgi:uncharacterized membrane protein YkoI